MIIGSPGEAFNHWRPLKGLPLLKDSNRSFILWMTSKGLRLSEGNQKAHYLWKKTFQNLSFYCSPFKGLVPFKDLNFSIHRSLLKGILFIANTKGFRLLYVLQTALYLWKKTFKISSFHSRPFKWIKKTFERPFKDLTSSIQRSPLKCFSFVTNR